MIYVGNKEVGEFMKKKVFEPGRTLTWNELTKHATGETLNAKAFAADFKAKEEDAHKRSWHTPAGTESCGRKATNGCDGTGKAATEPALSLKQSGRGRPSPYSACPLAD